MPKMRETKCCGSDSGFMLDSRPRDRAQQHHYSSQHSRLNNSQSRMDSSQAPGKGKTNGAEDSRENGNSGIPGLHCTLQVLVTPLLYIRGHSGTLGLQMFTKTAGVPVGVSF